MFVTIPAAIPSIHRNVTAPLMVFPVTTVKKVTIHSYGASGVRDAVRAGADSIEHGTDVDDETFAEMAKKGLGRIAQGFLSDLVAVDSNPITDTRSMFAG